MRPNRRRWTAGQIMLATAVATVGLAASPADAALPLGTLSRVSSEGPGRSPAIDDAGTTVAYRAGSAGHVMVGGGRIVPDAGAAEIAISGDGNVIGFATMKALGGGDSDKLSDVYTVNKDGSGLRLVSDGPGSYFSPSLSGNGGSVAFSGGANNPGAQREVWVRDGGNAPFKLDAGGLKGDAQHPSMSRNGNSVAFEVTDGGIFVWDRNGSSTRLPGSAPTGIRPSISGRGHMVAFAQDGKVKVYNRENRSTLKAPGDGGSPSLSADGSVVAYQASSRIGPDVNGVLDIAVWPVGGGAAELVSTGGTAGSYTPSLNSDGGRVAFASDSSWLGDANGVTDIYLRIPLDGATGGQCCPGGGLPDGGLTDDTPDVPGKYWLVASDGGIFAYGGLGVQPAFYGSTGDIRLNQPIVGMTPAPNGSGYWFVASDGGIFAYAGSKFYGSTGNLRLNKPIVGMSSTPSGNGYWMVASDGGIFSYGDAKFFGSTGDLKLNKPIVGMASTPSGNGYWMVASDGGIFSFGDAKFFGSTGDLKLNKPIVAMGARPQGDGYWMVASDGGVFSFGNAPFKGSAGSMALNSPVVNMTPTYTGNGYWFVTADGRVLNYGDAGFFGSMIGTKLARPIVGIAASR